MSTTGTGEIDRARYISFATRKRSGDFVATPVWFAPDAGGDCIFSAADAGKVKRLRNFSESRIAPCTVRGRVTGDWVETEAHLLEAPEDIANALAALHRKYGWQMRVTDLLSKLAGKINHRAFIRVSVRS